MAQTWCLLLCILSLSCLVLRLLAAQVPVCSVHGVPGKYTYEAKTETPTEECDCESWSNAEEIVLANCKGKDNASLVLNNNETCLVTSDCIEVVIYRRSCEKPYEIICVAKCPQALANHSQGSRSQVGVYISATVVLAVLVLAIAEHWDG